MVEGCRERRRHGGAVPARMRVIARPDTPVPPDVPPDEPPEAPDDDGP